MNRNLYKFVHRKTKLMEQKHSQWNINKHKPILINELVHILIYIDICILIYCINLFICLYFCKLEFGITRWNQSFLTNLFWFLVDLLKFSSRATWQRTERREQAHRKGSLETRTGSSETRTGSSETCR